VFHCQGNSNGPVQLTDIDNKYFNATSIASGHFNGISTTNISILMKVPRITGNCEATKIQVCFKEEGIYDNREYDVIRIILYECELICNTIAMLSLESKQIDPADCAMNVGYRVCCSSLNITNEKFRIGADNKYIGITPYDNTSLFKYNKFDAKSCCRKGEFDFFKRPLNVHGCSCNSVVLFRVLAGEREVMC